MDVGIDWTLSETPRLVVEHEPFPLSVDVKEPEETFNSEYSLHSSPISESFQTILIPKFDWGTCFEVLSVIIGY